MEIQKKELLLPEGKFLLEVVVFEQNDRKTLADIYLQWRKVSNMLIGAHGRAINVPEALSESIFALEFGCYRALQNISGANTSFDCFDPVTNSRIQVKACGVLPDLTSFGPRSVWDKIFFMDFLSNGKWDGTIDVYEINPGDIYSQVVNKHQTVADQQKENRRPRFSIWDSIIKRKNLRPVKSIKLF